MHRLAFVVLFLLLSRARFLLLGIVGGLGILVVPAIIGFAVEKWRVHKTRRWPVAAGTIGNVETQYIPGALNDGVAYWKTHFTYTYLVDGKEYTGTHHVISATEDQKAVTEEALQTGQAIVHYNPRDAASAVLWDDQVPPLS